MDTLIGAIIFISLGFVAGWRYGYKETTKDFERMAKYVLGRSGRG
jgi:hypothetical protein